MTGAPQRVARVAATLGEGPVWIGRDQTLWFVDIKQRRAYRFDPANGALDRWDAPEQIGWVLPARGGAFLAGLQSGLARFDPSGHGFARFGAIEQHPPGNRLNDATTDAQGRVWFGTMDDGEAASTGRFYVADAAGVRETGLAPVAITNGPAISPDGRILYHVDTLGRTIRAAGIRDDATLGPARHFVTIEDGAGHPDGPVVDGEGCVWIGLFGGWGVRRYAPDGRLIETVGLPTANVTKIAFGGADLKTAYVTTARLGLDAEALAAQPEAGDLFAFAVDVAGMPVTEAACAPE